jgi:hypothetical protein
MRNVTNMTHTKTLFSKITARPLLAIAVLGLSLGLQLVAASLVHAADLAQSSVRFDRIQTSTATTGMVCAKPTTVATEADVQITFPAGYTLGTAANFTVSTTNLAWPTGGTAWPGIATATNVTGQVVTLPSGDLTVGTLYCFNWTNSAAVTIKSGASSSNTGTIVTRTTTPTDIDTATYSTASVTSDQITVSATVPSTFSFALSASGDALGALSTGGVTTSPTPRTATLSTNAKNGWMVWAKDLNTGLTSATAAATIAATTPGTNSTLVAGTPGYNTGITTSQVGGSGTITVTAPFVGTLAGQGGGLDTSLRTIASSNGTADTAVLTLKNNVAIGSTTAAATDYADTVTVIGAGLF